MFVLKVFNRQIVINAHQTIYIGQTNENGKRIRNKSEKNISKIITFAYIGSILLKHGIFSIQATASFLLFIYLMILLIDQPKINNPSKLMQ